MEFPQPRHKGFYLLPNLFTTASLFAAFLSIIFTYNSNYEDAAIAILFSALMDGLDGKVARLTNTASAFGIQYDSLADLIAFGLSPAFMIYATSLKSYNKIGIAVSFLFVVCAALRLARFNVTTSTGSKRFFIGLPTPAAGCAIALLILFLPSLPELVRNNFNMPSIFIVFGLSILMVSRVRYSSFKELGFFKEHPFRTIVIVSIIFVLIVSDPIVYGFLILYGYILWGLFYTYAVMPKHELRKKIKIPWNKNEV